MHHIKHLAAFEFHLVQVRIFGNKVSLIPCCAVRMSHNFWKTCARDLFLNTVALSDKKEEKKKKCDDSSSFFLALQETGVARWKPLLQKRRPELGGTAGKRVENNFKTLGCTPAIQQYCSDHG